MPPRHHLKTNLIKNTDKKNFDYVLFKLLTAVKKYYGELRNLSQIILL